MSKKLEDIQIQFQKRNARAQGPTSSRDYNDSIDELGHDLSSFRAQWNERLVKLTSQLPDGVAPATDLNAFSAGLDGRTMYMYSAATLTSNTTYFNAVKNRPNSIWEQITNIYGDIDDLREDLSNEIVNNTLTASDIPIKDAASLYTADNVETALAEIGVKVDNLSGIGTGSVEEIAFFTSGGTVTGDSNFSWNVAGQKLQITGNIRASQRMELGQVASAPSTVAGYGSVYTGTDAELHYKDSSGTEIILSSVSGLRDVTIGTTASGEVLQWDGSSWVNATQSVGGSTTLDGLTDVTLTATASGEYIQYDGSTWVNVDALIGDPTSGDYTSGFTSTFTPATKVSDAIQTLNEVDYTLATLVATPPDNLAGQSLALAGTTTYSAKFPTGLPGGWGSYTPGATFTSYIVDPTYTLTSPNTSTRFSVGLDSNPAGTITHVEDAGDADARLVTAGTGVTGKLNVNSIATYNTVWKKANAIISDTQADGVRAHALKHTSAGQTNTTTLYYDSIATAPSFGVGITVGVPTENLKYLDGIAYYTNGTQFRVQGQAATGIFEQAYHPTNVGRIDITGESNFAVNPGATPAVGDTFSVDETRTVGLTGTEVFTDPTAVLRFYKPTGATVNQSSNLARDFLTSATNSTTTNEPFTDEAQRLVLGTATAWTAASALVTGNAQQFLQSNTARLAHPDEHDDYSFGAVDQDYERMFAAISRSNGFIDHANLTSISAMGTGTVNMFLQLETDSIWFDLGLVAGSNNGTGSGDSIANSKGAKITSTSSRTNFTLGAYNTGTNSNEFRMRVRFRSTGASITNLSYSNT